MVHRTSSRTTAATSLSVPIAVCARGSAIQRKSSQMREMSNGHVVAPINTVELDYEENGRLYHAYRKGIYMYPCDEAEKERMDVFHTVFKVARHGALHSAPLDKEDPDARILDLGTGTGIWAIEIADEFPLAEVIGIDLSNIQPIEIPRNLRFRVPKDMESSTWSLGEDSFNLIHIRQGCGSVSNWFDLYQKVFRHLKPGKGHLEHVEIDFQPRCDDGTLPDTPITLWYSHMKDATRRAGKPIEYPDNTRQMLELTGFTDIQERIIRAPFNAWPRDPHHRDIGRWYGVGLSDGIEAMSLAPFYRSYNWPLATIKRYADDVKKSIMTRKFHAYNNIHVWTARRPLAN